MHEQRRKAAVEGLRSNHARAGSRPKFEDTVPAARTRHRLAAGWVDPVDVKDVNGMTGGTKLVKQKDGSIQSQSAQGNGPGRLHRSRRKPSSTGITGVMIEALPAREPDERGFGPGLFEGRQLCAHGFQTQSGRAGGEISAKFKTNPATEVKFKVRRAAGPTSARKNFEVKNAIDAAEGRCHSQRLGDRGQAVRRAALRPRSRSPEAGG